MMSTGQDSAGGGTRYLGVSPPSYHGGKWRAFGRVNGRHTHIGYYPTAEEAARARDEVVRRQDDPGTLLNFPHPGEPALIGRVRISRRERVDVMVEGTAISLAVAGGDAQRRVRVPLSDRQIGEMIGALERARDHAAQGRPAAPD